MITINTIELLFAYEDGYCYKYRSYDKASEKDDEVYLCSYIRNLYYNCTEKLCEVRLHKRPTISEIKEFMNESKAMIRKMD